MSAIEHLPEFELPVDNGLLRFLTCGSVDDGKSTLIGRLLFDTKAILADTLNAIERTSKKRGLNAADLSLLTDGLLAEREQGITIDVAYRYFTTGTRKYIIADAPGHEQYTRNMVTAASTANLAIIMVDARKGVLTQTRRHSYIAHLLGIPHLIVAVNKMDLVGYLAETFEKIRTDYLDFANQLGITDVSFIPLSALEGDMVVDRGDKLSWYNGPTLLDILETAPAAHCESVEEFRFPVQYVCRVGDDMSSAFTHPVGSSVPFEASARAGSGFRGYMGRVESGEIAVGDAVKVLPSCRSSRVKDIQICGQSLAGAHSEQSITLLLDDEIDISRGDMIVRSEALPLVVKQLEAMVCWLSETPLDLNRRYLIRHTTRDTKALVAGIAYRLDITSLAQQPGARLAMNDIGRVSFKLAQPLFVDAYAVNRSTGAFIVIDETSNNTVGAGMIIAG